MNMLLTVNSEQFGEITVTPDSVISFVKPILGFSGYNQFVIVEDKELSHCVFTYYCLGRFQR